ncbi:threonine--tRNA ligase [bacterium]|nr:threonine--tRNA ligase [bacterium]
MSSKKNPTRQEILRHSAAHVLAAAVLEMFPEAKFGTGPAIEDGFYYDFELPRALIPEDLPILEEKMKKIIKANYPFEKAEMLADEAIKHFEKAGQNYKVELINDIKNKSQVPSYELQVTSYKTGSFIDLCSGPHIDSTGEINPNAFKLTKISGAYWKGDEKNKQLQRIYGMVFETEKELKKYLSRREEAKKRDHRKLAKQLELFIISSEVGKGLPLWLPKGAFIRKKIEDYMYELEKKNGYDFVYTPILARENLYKKSGHLAHYENDMYNPVEIEGENYYLKPMNCPHHHIIYKSKMRSYRDLPMRLSDFSVIHRFERSGVLTGLIRARSFSQNDAHIYCAQKQLERELLKVIELFKKVYADFNIKDYWFRLALPDFNNKEKYGGIEKKSLWEASAEIARQALKKSGEKYVEEEGEAAFYGPKIDVQVKNVLGKEDTIATMQIDFYMPERFGLEFVNKKGKRERPVILHRAIMGSFERFFAFLLEQTAGAFPLWLSPVQVMIIPVSEKFNSYAQKIHSQLLENDIRSKISGESESLGKRISEAEKQKIPYIAIVGEKEMESKTLSVRRRDNKEPASAKATAGKQQILKTEEFVKKILEEVESKK